MLEFQVKMWKEVPSLIDMLSFNIKLYLNSTSLCWQLQLKIQEDSSSLLTLISVNMEFLDLSMDMLRLDLTLSQFGRPNLETLPTMLR